MSTYPNERPACRPVEERAGPPGSRVVPRARSRPLRGGSFCVRAARGPQERTNYVEDRALRYDVARRCPVRGHSRFRSRTSSPSHAGWISWESTTSRGLAGLQPQGRRLLPARRGDGACQRRRRRLWQHPLSGPRRAGRLQHPGAAGVRRQRRHPGGEELGPARYQGAGDVPWKRILR